MGLYGDILRATDGSIFTFDKIYTITTEFFEEWIGLLSEGLSAEDLTELGTAEGLIKSSEEKSLYQELADYARLLSQKQIQIIVKGLAKNDDIFVGRYVLIEGINQVFTKVYRNKEYEYVKVADLNTLNLLDEANTDEWLNVLQQSSNLADIKLSHADPAPPIDSGDGTYIYPLTEETMKPNGNYFRKITDSTLDSEAKGWHSLGIMNCYVDGKGHQVKDQYEYKEEYKRVSDSALQEVFEPTLYYVPYLKDTINDKKVIMIKDDIASSEPAELGGYIKLTNWNYRNDIYQSIEDKSYQSNYLYYLKVMIRQGVTGESTEDGKNLPSSFTHPISEEDEYTLILNGGHYLND